MKKVMLLVLLLLSQVSFGQMNLVPNYSFEDTLNCATWVGGPNVAYPWFNPTIATPDYYTIYTSCGIPQPSSANGYQFPKTGDAYMGIGLYNSAGGREYIEAQLDSPLVSGNKYCVSFYINRAN